MSAAWIHLLPAATTGFLASLVECVEALTVVLAVGAVRGWRAALLGSAAALLVLLAVVLLAGPALVGFPRRIVQLAVGALLLLFGTRWLRKAVLRAAGLMSLHDENAAYAVQSALLRRAPHARHGWDGVAIATAFKITLLEGLEVVFIVIAVGAGGAGLWIPASLGAMAALLLVSLLGLIVHRPLARVPENTLKFAVGVLVTTFGTFWVGEGSGVTWPAGDWSLLGLLVGFLLIARLTVASCRSRRRARGQHPAAAPHPSARPMPWAAAMLREIFSLFVDDGSLAVMILIWLAAVWLALARLGLPAVWGAGLLFAGLAIIQVANALRQSP